MHYIGSKWILILHILLVMSVAISSFMAGHEVGFERSNHIQEITYDYAVMLEKENSRLNKRLKAYKQ